RRPVRDSITDASPSPIAGSGCRVCRSSRGTIDIPVNINGVSGVEAQQRYENKSRYGNESGWEKAREARNVNYFHFWENRRGLERARQTPQEARLRNSSRFDAIGTDEGT